MRPGQIIERIKKMATVIQLPQTSKWAKQDNLPPTSLPNHASRSREHLTPDEVERMIVAARQAGGRLAERDALLIMIAYRHGLRASELIALRWDQIDLKASLLHVARLKHGSPSTHKLCAVPSFGPCAPGTDTKATRRPTCSRHCAAVQ